ncbi:MAG: hypothetical protein AAF809_07210 [Bacteroidota bacterium]
MRLLLTLLVTLSALAPLHAQTLMDRLDGLPLYGGLEVSYVNMSAQTPAPSIVIRTPLPTHGFALSGVLGWSFPYGLSAVARPTLTLLPESGPITSAFVSADLGLRFHYRKHRLSPYVEAGYAIVAVDVPKSSSNGINLAAGVTYALAPRSHLVLDVRLTPLETEEPTSIFGDTRAYERMLRVSVGILGFGR